jgi:hypothetical protein
MNLSFIILIASAAIVLFAGMMWVVTGEPNPSDDWASPIPKMTAKLVEQYAYAGGTNAEIADRFLSDEAHIADRYRHILRSVRAQRKIHIRSLQFDLAKKLNASMLIWMGRNDLGQSTDPPPPEEPMPEFDAE